MAAALTDIRNAVKAALAPIVVNSYAVEPTSPNYPAAWVFPAKPAADFDETMDGATTWHLIVTVAVQAADLSRAQTNLDPFLSAKGTKSIKATLETDITLGGLVDSLCVKGIIAYGPLDLAGTSILAAQFAVEVYA